MSNVFLNSTSNSSSSTSSSGLLRVPGMASGLDTDSIVKSMVSSYQNKIDKANQDEQLLQWKQSAYRDIIKGIKDLQNYFDPLSSKYIMGSNSLNINTTTSDNTSVVNATAGNSAKAGTYSINVTQLATQAVVSGTNNDSLVQVSDLSKWSGKTLDFGAGTITLSNITDTTLNSTNLSKLASDINTKISASSALSGKISASYVSVGGKNYIKFTNLSSSSVTLKSGGSTTASEVTKDLAINSGISAASKLTSSGLGIVANSALISAKNFTDSTINSQTLTDGTNTLSLTGLSGYTGADLATQINNKIAGSSLNGKVSAEYVKDGNGNDCIRFTSPSTSTATITYNDSKLTSSGSGVSFNGSGGDISFVLSSGTSKYNVSLAVDNNTTMQNLIDAVNSATSGTITMKVDDTTGGISFQSKNSGSSSSISIADTSTGSNNLSQLGISSNSSSVGTDAIVSIKEPGQASATTTTESSNNFTVNGVSYNLVAPSTSSSDITNITIASNADNVVTNIKNFITDYNTLISTINTKLTEKKDPAYPPLTDAQKSTMSQDQITAWESKAKVGILRNDDNLSQLMTQLRSVFSAPVYSSYDSSDPSKGKIGLSFGKYGSNAIGIDTSSDVTDGGKLVIADETKLRNAITNNFDDFKKLFTGASSAKLADNASYIGSEKYNEDGLLKRMDTVIRSYVSDPGIGTDGTYSLSGTMNIFVNKQYDFSLTGTASQNTLPDQVYSKTLSISKLKTQMSDAETRYYNQFTQLETALTQLNSQQSSLSSMLGTS